MSTEQLPGAEASLSAREASRRVSELFRRVVVSQAVMSSALEIPKLSDALKQLVFRDHLAGKTGLRSLAQQLKPVKEIDPVRDFEKLAQGLAEQAAVNGEMVIAAAVIVLSHSTADDVFTGACALAVELDPAKWISELSLDRKVSLRTLHEKGTDGVFSIELARFRGQLSGKSLPNRSELLFRHVKIEHHKMIEPQHPMYFRLSTLKEADDLRISIVHGNGLPKIDVQRSHDTMQFLHEAGITALRSLANSYELGFDFNVFLKPAQQPKG